MASIWAQRAALLRDPQILSEDDLNALAQLFADALRTDMRALNGWPLRTGKGAAAAACATTPGPREEQGDDTLTDDSDEATTEADTNDEDDDEDDNDTAVENAEPTHGPPLSSSPMGAPLPATTVSDCCIHAPRAHSAAQTRYEIAERIANRLFAPADGQVGSPEQQLWARIKYGQLVSRLKRAYHAQQQAPVAPSSPSPTPKLPMPSTAGAEGATCVRQRRVEFGGPPPGTIHPDVLEPKAMPVNVSPPGDFEALFEFLRQPERTATFVASDSATGTSPQDPRGALHFQPRGVFYTDGRVDLCKQVVGPQSIAALLESMRDNPHVHHFLLGNNIVNSAGAEAIAAYIAGPHANKIRTWYIAGNDLDANGTARIADALATDHDATQLWLKRNPLKPAGASALARMLQVNTTLVTLDLAITGLLDEGLAVIMSALTTNTLSGLRHLFLGGNGLTAVSGRVLSDYFAAVAAEPHRAGLESLWVDVNHLGDEGLIAMSAGISAYARRAIGHSPTTLRRLAVGSNAASDTAVATVLGALHGAPGLIYLNLGLSVTTNALGARANVMGEASAAQLATLIQTAPSLSVLDLTCHHFSPTQLDDIMRAAASDDPGSLLYMAMASPGVGHGDPAVERAAKAAFRARVRTRRNISYATFRESAVHPQSIRFIRNPPDVEAIDSVYRNAERFHNRFKSDPTSVKTTQVDHIAPTRPEAVPWEAWRNALVYPSNVDAPVSRAL